MCSKFFSLISVFVLTLACTSYGLVIDDFEGDTIIDAWRVNDWDSPPGSLSLSTIGVTSGNQSMKIDVPRAGWTISSLVTFGHSENPVLMDPNEFLPIYLASQTIEMDVTFVPDDWTDAEEGAWAGVSIVINSQNGGWGDQGSPDIDDLREDWPGNYDPAVQTTTHTRHLTWDITDTHASLANGGGDWFEMMIIVNSGGFPNGGAIIIDNVQLVGAEAAPKIIWVSEWNSDADGVPFDQGWIDLLEAEGYDVDANTAGDYKEVSEAELATLESADLIIVSRNSNSGNYAGDVNEVTLWNSVETPLILMSAYITRNHKWQWIDSGTTNQGVPATSMDVVAVDHPVFAGVTLDANNVVDVIDEAVSSETTEIGATDAGNGTLLATRVDNGNIWIAEWEAGVGGYEGTDQVLAGKRMYFAAGGGQGQESGAMSFNEAGQTMFLNAVEYMLAPVTWDYTFDGDAAVYGAADSDDSLDGTWDHNNGSDQWDGSGVGEGAPGGVSALVEDDVTFLRIQDTGNPTSYGFSDPSNRKVYLTHALDYGLEAVALEFKIRIATTAPLDAMADGTPWPEGGMSGRIMDRGKGMVGIGDKSMNGMVSFSLALAGNDGAEGSDMLLMNALNGQGPADEVDTGQGIANAVAIADATAWNTVSATIVAGGTGTHVVTVSVNGGDPQSFDVTVGTKFERSDDVAGYIGIGSSGTGAFNGFDIDYISVQGL